MPAQYGAKTNRFGQGKSKSRVGQNQGKSSGKFSLTTAHPRKSGQ
jgi:hypothetical protein